MPRLFAALCACLLLLARPAFPWWETGHQVIARIAAAHLMPTARTRIARIFNVDDSPEAVAEAMVKASTWADETRAQTNTGEWHYIDLTLEDGKSDIPVRCPNDNCNPARIRLFAAQLSSKVSDPQWSDLDALRFLIHLVGDLHQPLHAVDNADLGGNCEQLPNPIDTAKNLHAYWDGALVAELSHDERALSANLESEIEHRGRGWQRHMSAGNPDGWAWESHELAAKVIYHRLRIPLEPVEFPKSCKEAPTAITSFRPQTTPSYTKAMEPVARLQLEKAGLRLARLLNDTF